MRLIKIGIGSVDPTVGAVRPNVDRILRALQLPVVQSNEWNDGSG